MHAQILIVLCMLRGNFLVKARLYYYILLGLLQLFCILNEYY